jgi:hypothetical protein|tara:strand:+ start:2124 stop:2648 length:525 start_codon:yes stop_codon:yes gene_type:complete
MYQKCKRFIIIIIISSLVISCGIYSFTGSSIPVGVETFQVDYFENTAGGKPGSTIEPGLDRDFTIALQDLIVNQTSLNLVNEGGDIKYSGEIIEFSVTPMAATAEIRAAQNRLTMAVMVNYENVLNEEDNIEKRFSFYYDFPGNLQVYDIKDSALEEIFERIIQDIFNETLAKW